MTQFHGLVLAIDLAVAKRDHVLAELNRRLQAHAFAQSQLDQLRQYADETELRWAQAAQKSTTPELLHHHYQFMGRLQQAIELQQGVLASCLGQLTSAQQTMLQAEFRLAGLKQVLSKRRQEQTKIEQRRDQKQMDEFAAMQTLRQARQKLESRYEC
jgi:flagellar FliJ protein